MINDKWQSKENAGEAERLTPAIISRPKYKLKQIIFYLRLAALIVLYFHQLKFDENDKQCEQHE